MFVRELPIMSLLASIEAVDFVRKAHKTLFIVYHSSSQLNSFILLRNGEVHKIQN